MTKIAVITLGCPKNTADTESVLAELPEGCELSSLEEAETVLLNSCAFLASSRKEVYENLDRLKDKKVILIGCLTTQLKSSFFEEYSQVWAIVAPINYPQIAEVIEQVVKDKKMFAVEEEPKEYVDMSGKVLITPPSYSYIKIAEGCNNACSYCLIPKLRGQYRSRPMESILSEVEGVVATGVKELILVAQDCSAYGMDLYKEKKLSELLKKIAEIKGDFWVRVLYVYPERIDDNLLKTIAESDKICNYLDIPLQHGDADILKAMRRPYDLERTLERINHVREMIPGVVLRTSLIAGFPGETEEAFENLMGFIKKIQFDHLGVFEYSREKKTTAYHLENQVPEEVKTERKEKAMQLQQEISLEKNKALAGQKCKVLIEDYDVEEDLYIGRSERHTPDVDGVVLVKSEKELELNEFYEVEIVEGREYDLVGKIIHFIGE